MSRRYFRGGHPRPKLDAFRPGHTFLMPEGATWLNLDKPRPFVLATPCDHGGFGTLVYGSTRETERAAGAPVVEVIPKPLGVNTNGLRSRTFFYPGLLIPSKHASIPPHLGHLGPQLLELRRTLSVALGIGSGTCTHSSAPEGSRRGRIVVLDQSFAPVLHTRHAVVLTEHTYSREERYQVVVPIVRKPAEATDANVVHVGWQPWFEVFAEPTTAVLFVPPVVQSVWHHDDIIAESQFIVDQSSLAVLEERLCRLFQLEGTGV